ncbi:unnamed protein product, partial [Rotaria sp. Silwood2]
MQVDMKETIINGNNSVQSVYGLLFSASMRSYILLIVGIPSFMCYVFIIVYVLTNRNHRSAPNNYCLLIILNLQFFCNIIDIPSEIYFYREGRVIFENAIYCYIWQFLAYTIWPINVILLAWAAFERHILIFHDRFLRSKRGNICLHYAPPLIIITY